MYNGNYFSFENISVTSKESAAFLTAYQHDIPLLFHRQIPFLSLRHRFSLSKSSPAKMKTKILTHKLEVPSDERTVASIWINDDIRPLPPHRRR